MSDQRAQRQCESLYGRFLKIHWQADWNKVIDGQINLRDAVNGTISYSNEAGKIYQLKPNPAVLICRARGLHLPEKHVTWRGETIPGSLFDFALYFFHNYQALLAKGSGPYFYLPKTQVLAGSGLVERSLQPCRRSL